MLYISVQLHYTCKI